MSHPVTATTSAPFLDMMKRSVLGVIAWLFAFDWRSRWLRDRHGGRRSNGLKHRGCDDQSATDQGKRRRHLGKKKPGPHRIERRLDEQHQ